MLYVHVLVEMRVSMKVGTHLDQLINLQPANKGDNFCALLFAFLHISPLLKRGLL